MLTNGSIPFPLKFRKCYIAKSQAGFEKSSVLKKEWEICNLCYLLPSGKVQVHEKEYLITEGQKCLFM